MSSLLLQTNMHKAEKELNDVAARWEEIKKNAPQVSAAAVHQLQPAS